MTTGPHGQRTDSERGALTLMLAAMFVALLALAGLVIDGGAKLNAAGNATAIAQEAARAGANQISQQTAYSSGAFVVNPQQAVSAASQYLAGAGYKGTVQVTGPTTIQVVVTVRVRAKVLSLIGIDWLTASGTATATLEAGVTGPGA
jgi:Flp pilus assembly protein TadG